MSDFTGFTLDRNHYSETNIDLTCRGFDNFQDCIFFHSPVLGLGANMPEGPEKVYWMKKFERKQGYFPARPLACLQPSRGKIVLPKGNPDLVELWNFYQEHLGLEENQVIWFDHDVNHTFEEDLMADEVACQTLREIASAVPKGDPRRRFFLFAERPELHDWAEELGLELIRDTAEWSSVYGKKDILHPAASSEKRTSFLQDCMPHVKIPVPRGYVCKTTADLLKAVELMRADPGPPMKNVLIKPIGTSDGEGIISYPLDSPMSKFEEYPFAMGTILLEERLELDMNPDGTVMTIVSHYCGRFLLGPSCDQLIGNEESPTAFIGNVYPSVCPRPLRKRCETMVQNIIQTTHPVGPGGFDFLFQRGEPFLVDVNSGRFNGGMFPKAFHKQYAARGTAYVSFKYKPHSSLADMWVALKEKNWAFTPMLASDTEVNETAGNYGIYPMVHLKDNFGYYVAIANTTEECLSLKQMFTDLGTM
jgi:hypothetical protein